MPVSIKEKILAAQKKHIEDAKALPYKTYATISTKGCCKECSMAEGKKFTYEEAITGNLVPQKNCTRESHCTCRLLFHAIRDENDRLINK